MSGTSADRSASNSRTTTAARRSRGDFPISGTAPRRGAPGVTPPICGPWCSGFVYYNPWFYWGWYGSYWYDPWPYGWYGGGYGGYGGSYVTTHVDDSRRTGSIRLKANPKDAKVYIDGALVGTVDDFNGLSNHLELDEGTYQLELRADGYQPYSGELEVVAGKTLTERVSLKKQK